MWLRIKDAKALSFESIFPFSRPVHQGWERPVSERQCIFPAAKGQSVVILETHLRRRAFHAKL